MALLPCAAAYPRTAPNSHLLGLRTTAGCIRGCCKQSRGFPLAETALQQFLCPVSTSNDSGFHPALPCCPAVKVQGFPACFSPKTARNRGILKLVELGLSYTSSSTSTVSIGLFAAVDDIFCLFQGHIENIPHLKQQYGLSKTANEVIIVIEAYRTLRDRGPYPADKVVRDLSGKFAFILFDSSSKTTFIAADADGSLPFFWGSDSSGHLVLSDDVEIVKKGRGKSFAPFPKGCFFTTSKGLQSFEHPLSELKPVPRVDSKGQVCGAIYTVDAEAKKRSFSYASGWQCRRLVLSILNSKYHLTCRSAILFFSACILSSPNLSSSQVN